MEHNQQPGQSSGMRPAAMPVSIFKWTGARTPSMMRPRSSSARCQGSQRFPSGLSGARPLLPRRAQARHQAECGHHASVAQRGKFVGGCNAEPRAPASSSSAREQIDAPWP